MNYHLKKRFHLIKIGLLLLTALFAKVHASDGTLQDQPLDRSPKSTVGSSTISHSIDAWSTSGKKRNAPPGLVPFLMVQLWKMVYLVIAGVLHARDTFQEQLLDKLNTPTVAFATVLHSIDTTSCYDWLKRRNKRSARRMGNRLMAQLWKMVWLVMVAVHAHDEILFRYALLSKLAIDILAQLVHNSKIATMLSHWLLGWAVAHCYVLLNQQNLSWGKLYFTLVLTFSIYYLVYAVLKKYQESFGKKVLGFGEKRIGTKYLFVSYHLFSYLLFSVVVGVACAFAPLGYDMLSKFLPLSKSWIEGFLVYSPFVILLLEYAGS